MKISTLIVCMAAIALSACVGPQGRGSEAMSTYIWEAAFAPKPAAREGKSILVAAPQARPGFDTERMAYVRSANQIEYFSRNRWVDAPARMMSPLIVQALESTGAFSAVMQAPTVARAQWRLEVEIVKVQQDFMARPSVSQLVLRAQLIDVATQRPVATRLFEAAAPAASEDARGGAQAMNAALNQILPRLSEWAGATALATQQFP